MPIIQGTWSNTLHGGGIEARFCYTISPIIIIPFIRMSLPNKEMKFPTFKFPTSAVLKFHHLWHPPRSERWSRSPEGAPYKTLHFGVQPQLNLSSKALDMCCGEAILAEAAHAASRYHLPSQGQIVLRKTKVYSTSRYPQHKHQYGAYYSCPPLSHIGIK